MKKLLFLSLLAFSLEGSAQPPGWIFSINSGIVLGGPLATIKSKMKFQGFDEGTSWSFGFGSNSGVPSSRSVSIILRAERSINSKKALFFSAGLADNGYAKGYRENDQFFSPPEDRPRFSYTLYQVNAGLMFSGTKSRNKVGFGPSLFVFDYSLYGEEKTSLVPGASLIARLPLSKGKKQLGLAIMLDGTLAPPVKVQLDNPPPNKPFKPGSVNMFSGSIGIAITFQKN